MKGLKVGHKIKPKVCEGCKVPKGWGEELIIENIFIFYLKKVIKNKNNQNRASYPVSYIEEWVSNA